MHHAKLMLWGRCVLVLLCGALARPFSAVGQEAGHFGIRAGAGTDVSGRAAYSGQIEYAETDGRNSVELAIAGFGGTLSQDSFVETDAGTPVRDTYHEETDVIGVGLVANFLFRHGLDVGGPYFVLGGGVGSFSVDWRRESPTDDSLGNLDPQGGSFETTDGLALGSILNVGLGQRFGRFFDVRAQLPLLIVAGADPRGLKLVPIATLSAAVGF